MNDKILNAYDMILINTITGEEIAKCEVINSDTTHSNLDSKIKELEHALILEFANDYNLSYEEAKVGLAEWILFDETYGKGR